MRIARISKIKDYRIFRDFTWPDELHHFAQFNVIYGWNGTGKTTLSSLFEHLQNREATVEGEIEFELDTGETFSGSEIPNATFPSVKVFNRDFVMRTVESIQDESIAPIYYLGEDSISKQKEVHNLKKELEDVRKQLNDLQQDAHKIDKALDDFCIEKAKQIKDTLIGSRDYANYDKRSFKNALQTLNNTSPKPQLLSEKQKTILLKQKALAAKATIDKISVIIPDIEEIRLKVLEFLKKSVVAQVIAVLTDDSEVSSWVQKGLSLHKGKRETNICRFCGNEITSERKNSLEAHFNEALISFQDEIIQYSTKIMNVCQLLDDINFPDESRFYEDLVVDYRAHLEAAKEEINNIQKQLMYFQETLLEKKANPFIQIELDNIHTAADPDQKQNNNYVQDTIGKINAMIDRHESTTKNLNNKKKEACFQLEQDYVLQAQKKYNNLSKQYQEAKEKLSSLESKPEKLRTEIVAIENTIIEYRRPAEELTSELRSYLGRDELRFEVEDTGYSLSRKGKPALNLSEGERTAIAFLYFLKSLEDKDFELSKGIVVIDDPVCSLDSNSLFSAFGFMKERTKTSHQLIILTHNFAFFRQVKNWFHHMKGQGKKDIEKRPARLYNLFTGFSSEQRSATISYIDPLLEKFESEYHFLFKQVHDVASNNNGVSELADYYGMPNIARRLVETFLAYRYPDCDGDLIHRLERAHFETEKKTRIIRLLNTYSHSNGIAEPEPDPMGLAETCDVMKMILDLIRNEDQSHFDGMIKLMQPAGIDE